MSEVALPGWAKRLWEPARYKAAYGGRGSAKSHTFAAALLLQGAARPLRILCAREIQKSVHESVKALLDTKIDECGLGGFYQSLQYEIRGQNGTQFIFAGLRSNIASIKSMEGLDRVWIEEAQSVSKTSLEVLIPTLRAPGSEIWLTWNPEKPEDPIETLLRCDDPPAGAIVMQVNHDMNPWFPEELRLEMERDRRRDPEKYQHVWLGGYKRNSEARVFKNWRVADADDPCWAPDEDRIYRFGADWGFAVDPSVLIRCWLEDRTLYVDHEAYAIGCPIDQTPALFAGSDWRDPPRWPNPRHYAGIPEAYRWPIVADSARPETIDYMKSRGFDIQSAIKGAGSVEDGVEFLQSVDIVVHPRCQHTIDELTFYSWKIDPHNQAVLPILADKDNHVIDALRYALEGVRRGMGSLEHIAADERKLAEMWRTTAHVSVEPMQTRGQMWR